MSEATYQGIRERADQLFRKELGRFRCDMDRLFAAVMSIQFVICVLLAFIVSPRTWIGARSDIHVHILASIVIGFVLASLPIALSILRPGRTSTRHIAAISQMLFSALLIHVTGGRIETHFHVFGSLALLAGYRDLRVLLTASAVVAADHCLRGIFWPESVFGILASSPLRWVEHTMWVLFEDGFLVLLSKRTLETMRLSTEREARLEYARDIADQDAARKGQRIVGLSEQLTAQLRAIDLSSARIEFNCQGIILDANTNFMELVGYSLNDLVDNHYRVLLHAEDVVDNYQDDFWSSLEHGSYRSGEFRLKRKDGKEAWWQAAFNPVLNEDGRVRKIVAYGHDITQRVTNEIELQSRTNYLRGVIDGQPSRVVILDEEGRISNANHACREAWRYLRGTSTGNLIGQSYLEICHELLETGEADTREILTAIERVLSGRSEFESVTYAWGSGAEHRWYTATVAPVGVGQSGFIVSQADVTELVSTREKLTAVHEQNELLALVVRGTTNAVLMADRDWTITWTNAGFRRISGFASMEICGKRPDQLGLLDLGSRRTLVEIRKACRRKQPYRGKIQCSNRWKHSTWIDLDIQPLFDSIGQLSGYMAIASDVSELVRARQEAEAALREINALRTALDQHALISVTDKRGAIVEVNTGFCRLSGYTRDELIGADHRILSSGAHPKSFWKGVWSTISAGKAWRGEICNRNKNGELFWVDSTIVPYVGGDGDVEKYVAIRFDVTDKKLAERDIEVIQTALDEHSILSIADRGGRITHVNRGFCQVSGYSAEELIGQDHSILNSGYHPHSFWAEVWQNLRRGKTWRGEVCNRRKDGSLYWVDSTMVPYVGADGTVEKYVSIRFDITTRKESQKKLDEAQALLEQTGRVARIGGWELDMESMTPRWTDETFRIHDLEPGSKIDLERAIDFYAPAARETISEAIQQGMKRGESWDLELPFVSSSGRQLWVRTIGIPQMEEGRCVKLWGAFQDITDQRQAQEQVRSLARRLETATEGAGVGVWELIPETETLRWDETIRNIYGVSSDEPPSYLDTWRDAIHPDDRGAIESMLKLAVETGERFEARYRIRRSDGHWRHIYSCGVIEPTESPEGELRVIGINSDITQQCLVEERLSLAMKVARISMWEWDLLDEKTFEQNMPSQDLLRLLGYETSKSSVFEYSLKELIHPDDLLAADHEINRHLQGLTPTYRHEHRFRRHDGSWHWLLAVGEVVEQDANGKPLRMIGVHVDIQELKEIATQLELSINSTGAGIWDWNIPKATLSTNPMFHTMIGEEPINGELPADYFFSRLHPDDQQPTLEAVQEAHAIDGKHYSVEFRLRCQDGNYRWIHSTGRVIERATDGSPLRMIGQHTDVDSHRKAQESIERLNKSLASQISYAKSLVVQADAANRAKSEFLANMSHEIRTPMTAILGYAETLAENLTKTENFEAISTIQRNGEHLLRIINDVLDLSKIEAGKFCVEQIEFSLSDVLVEIRKLMTVRAEEKNLAWEVELASPLPARILGDPTRLRQILINLVGNAIKFTETGSVRLVAKARPQGKEVALEFNVIDTGIGLSSDQQVNLFQPFNQGDTSMSRKFGGTGLGLAISKRFAELLGGDIEVQSEVGKGSTFRLSVAAKAVAGGQLTHQLDSPTMEPPQQRRQPVANPLQGTRLLLVEDGPDNQKLISFVLQRAGAQVELAENGAIAIDKVTQAISDGNPFDVVVMDMQMPVKDGYTATSELRSMGVETPIIALTAHAMTSDRQKCLDAGYDDYATKPVNREKLVDIIHHFASTPIEEKRPSGNGNLKPT